MWFYDEGGLGCYVLVKEYWYYGDYGWYLGCYIGEELGWCVVKLYVWDLGCYEVWFYF